jgi:hypothetical protein
MSAGVHLLVKDANNANGAGSNGVVDRVSVDEQNPIAFADVVTAGPQLRVISQQLNPPIEFVQVLVGLLRVPLLEAVFPDFDEIAFCEAGLVNCPPQAFRPCVPRGAAPCA